MSIEVKTIIELPIFLISMYLYHHGLLYVTEKNSEFLKINTISYEYSISKFQVFDCFLYNGESEMLYIHLWRLYKYINRFIIAISNTTFSGNPNKVSFAPFEKEINQYMNKITIIYVDITKAPKGGKYEQAWLYEEYQRNALLVGLKENNPNAGDLIFVEDVDEIITRKGINMIFNNPPDDFYHINGLLTPNNYLQSIQIWRKPFVIRYKENMTPFNQLRQIREENVFPKNEYIMTHCSYCFNNINQYIRKFQAFSHTEFNKFPFTDPSFIFRVNYCRRHPPFYKVPTKPIKWDEELVPPDPKLSYLVDPNFILDITQTNYSKSELPTICDGLSQYNVI